MIFQINIHHFKYHSAFIISDWSVLVLVHSWQDNVLCYIGFDEFLLFSLCKYTP